MQRLMVELVRGLHTTGAFQAHPAITQTLPPLVDELATHGHAPSSSRDAYRHAAPPATQAVPPAPQPRAAVPAPQVKPRPARAGLLDPGVEAVDVVNLD